MIMKRKKKYKFDVSYIDSMQEKSYSESVNCRLILPLTQIYGFFYITNMKIYFQPINNTNIKPCKKILIENITNL